MMWLLFPLFSTGLLILSFYPFHVWPLGFVALVPLIYFIEKNPTAYKKIFASGLMVGTLFPLALMRDTVMEFTWLPEAHFFQTIIRWTSLPIALIIGLLYGGAVLLYARKLRTASATRNIFISALIWALAEWLITIGTGGYNLGVLARTVTSIPFFVSLAAIGGISFVSLIVILCNTYVASVAILLSEPGRFSLRRQSVLVASIAAAVLALFFVNTWYLRHGEIDQTIPVAVLQNSDRKDGAFGTFDRSQNTFSFDKLASLVREAQDLKPAPAIIIYPFSVSKEILSSATSSASYVATAPLSKFGDWVGKTLGDTTFVTWNTLEDDTGFLNEIDYWSRGTIVTAYDKIALFPFMDYTPQWAENFGFYSTVVDEIPGKSDQPAFSLEAARIKSAVCSEVSSAETIRENARGANILFSIGSDAMFSDSFAAEFDLASAQFRAAENNIAVVRANRFGPSGFIAPDGRVLLETAYGADGAFAENVPYEEHPRRTLYSATGDTLFVLGSIITIGMLVFL